MDIMTSRLTVQIRTSILIINKRAFSSFPALRYGSRWPMVIPH